MVVVNPVINIKCRSACWSNHVLMKVSWTVALDMVFIQETYLYSPNISPESLSLRQRSDGLAQLCGCLLLPRCFSNISSPRGLTNILGLGDDLQGVAVCDSMTSRL